MKTFFENLGYYTVELVQWLIAFWFVSIVAGLTVRLTDYAWGAF